jgi:hypothetical protein
LTKPDRWLVEELNRLLRAGRHEEAVALMRKDVRASERAVLYLTKDVRQRGEALLHREILRELDGQSE